MRILIANDDGYLAPGLAALVRACAGPRRHRRHRPRAERQRHLQRAHAEPAAVDLRGARRARAGLSRRQRHAVGLRARGADRAARRSGPTWCCRASTTAPTWATTRCTRAPWPRRWKAILFGIPAIAFSQVEKGWGAPRRRGRRGARRRRPGAGAGAAGRRALAAEREHSQPRRCGGAAARRHAAGPAPCQRAGDRARPTRAASRSTGSARPATRANAARAPTSTPWRRAASRSRRCRWT